MENDGPAMAQAASARNAGIQRADGTQDKIAYRDVRFMLGLERKVIHGLGACVELGYVFSRKLTYYSNTPELDPAGTLLLRGGLNY